MILETAGCIGVEPWGFTMRELYTMAAGKQKNEWEKLSVILCMLHNVNCAKKEQFKTPRDFNPLAEKQAPKKMTMAEFKSLIGGDVDKILGRG